MAKVVWYGPQVQSHYRTVFETRLDKAAERLRLEITSSFGQTPHGMPPSVQMTPPHTVSGKMLRSIFNRVGSTRSRHKIVREVGSEDPIAIMWETIPGPIRIRPKTRNYLARRVSLAEGQAIVGHYNPTGSRIFPRLWQPKGSGTLFVVFGKSITIHPRPWLVVALDRSLPALERIIRNG